MRATGNGQTKTVLAFGICALLAAGSTGCKRIATYAVERALGDDAGLDLTSSGSSSSSSGDLCKLVTDAEVETATGRKVLKHDSDDSSCGWALGGAKGSAGESTASGNINMNLIGEVSAKVIPVLGEQKEITGVGAKAEWTGGMSNTLRVHVKGDNVLMFMVVDPTAMMMNPGITEKALPGAKTEKGPDGKEHVVSGTSAVNMENGELEKWAVAIAKIAVSRY